MPMLHSNPNYVIAMKYTEVTITCIFSGNPVPEIMWERKSRVPLPLFGIRQRKISTLYSDRSVLVSYSHLVEIVTIIDRAHIEETGVDI